MTATIVVIEDEPATCAVIVGHLSRRGHRVVGCGTLKEAEKALFELRPDVVVSDIKLPDGNGTQFCTSNADRLPQTRWLLMSSNEDLLRQSRDVKRGKGAPPFYVIDKPVGARVLDDFVHLAMLAKATSLLSTPSVEMEQMLL
jgi:DNA-binding NtrC family response regulator